MTWLLMSKMNLQNSDKNKNEFISKVAGYKVNI